ncbi:MtnX-like HAD-IB family phosphatase [Alkalicoccus chagannorensis]|uniref:MtnX-like HAD-IB family phosphatase n=1 Tax=Alkalicoccus chagannorensis TaxID=427072 RepID=UPI0004293E05|nr:MtnX-like HAD-IB family phosphatase [Alkalicoccus chagannorensis]
MKRAVITDFDGTITTKDFYWLAIESGWPEGEAAYRDWKEGKWKDRDFLQESFRRIAHGSDSVEELTDQIPYDHTFPAFFRRVKEAGHDVYIVSAGADYYIRRFFDKLGIEVDGLYANPSYSAEGALWFDLDPSWEHYNDRYGISKKSVVEAIAAGYDETCYIGDSEPDRHAAGAVDLMFARDQLIEILRREGRPFHPIAAFSEVADVLQKQGWIK